MRDTRAPDSGFSLLELVAVLAVFAVVGVLSTNALSGGLKGRTQIAEASQHTADIAAAFAVLRRDLEGMVPVSSVLAGKSHGPSFKVAEAGQTVSFFIKAPRGPDQPDVLTLTWVQWSVTGDAGTGTGTLMRSTAPIGASVRARQVSLLSGVERWQVNAWSASRRVFEPGQQWAREPANQIPAGVEIRLNLTDVGPMRLVVAR